MFATKKFKDAKTKKFENDKERKRFFAIQSYYKNKTKHSAYSSKKKTKDK